MLVVPPQVDGGERKRTQHDERKRAPVALPARGNRNMNYVGQSQQDREILRKKRQPEKDAGERVPAGCAPDDPQPEGERRCEAKENERRVGRDKDSPYICGEQQEGERGERRLRFVRAAQHDVDSRCEREGQQDHGQAQQPLCA